MFNSFYLAAVVTVKVVSFSRFVGFVVDCAVQNLKGCFFGFGLKTVHSYNVVSIVVGICRWVEDSVFPPSMIGRGCPEACILNCPICLSVVVA
jgi:hypothetical protein